jgi:hypothetical protein
VVRVAPRLGYLEIRCKICPVSKLPVQISLRIPGVLNSYKKIRFPISARKKNKRIRFPIFEQKKNERIKQKRTVGTPCAICQEHCGIPEDIPEYMQLFTDAA